MTDPLIQIENLSFSRGSKAIFTDLNLTIARHQVTAVMGPSGTGKTTLLSLIGGQLKPKEGTITVKGQVVSQLSQKKLYQLRKEMGILFQEGGLFTDLNVFDNVAFPLRQHTDLNEAMVRDLVLLMLQAVGLRGAAKLFIHELSGGMARRVALARSVVLGPEVMLYDEPFSGQDPIGRGVLLRLIRELNDALGLTSVVVSHDVLETAEIADYVYIIDNGKVIGQGQPKALFEEKSADVYQFVHGLPDGPVSFQYPAEDLTKDLLG